MSVSPVSSASTTFSASAMAVEVEPTPKSLGTSGSSLSIWLGYYVIRNVYSKKTMFPTLAACHFE